MVIELPPEKLLRIFSLIKKLKPNKIISIRDFSKILGFLVSCCTAVNYGWAHTKKFLALTASNNNYDATKKISNAVIDELEWWKNLVNPRNLIRIESYELEIYSDSSLTGWGAVCNNKKANGHWTESEKVNSINYLELLAAYFGQKIFANQYDNCQILLHIDNSTAISYINRMGGVQFKNLNKITRKIWQWCERKNIWIFATYIASKDNFEADVESRKAKANIEIALSHNAFEKIRRSFGNPDIDLFATRSNAKCSKYVSWKKDPESIAIDAFTISWSGYFFYAFLPFSLILKTIKKIQNDKARGIIIVPEWQGQPWYPLFKKLRISNLLKFDANECLIFSSNVQDSFWKKNILVAAILSAEHSN